MSHRNNCFATKTALNAINVAPMSVMWNSVRKGGGRGEIIIELSGKQLNQSTANSCTVAAAAP
jgi:hypothetical protein